MQLVKYRKMDDEEVKTLLMENFTGSMKIQKQKRTTEYS